MRRAHMVSDMPEADGWGVRFLGTDMPHAGVLHAVEEHQADMVGISATMLFQPVARAPREAFRSAPGAAAEVGADGFAPDLRSAVTLLRE